MDFHLQHFIHIYWVLGREYINHIIIQCTTGICNEAMSTVDEDTLNIESEKPVFSYFQACNPTRPEPSSTKTANESIPPQAKAGAHRVQERTFNEWMNLFSSRQRSWEMTTHIYTAHLSGHRNRPRPQLQNQHVSCKKARKSRFEKTNRGVQNESLV